MIGGKDEERLVIEDCFELGIKKTDMADMANLIARHKARYHLGAFLARPGMSVLDFPCGTGYGSEFFKDTHYHGMDYNIDAIEYAKLRHKGIFSVADMRSVTFNEVFDLILCIEGLEHIEQEYQEPIIKAFRSSLIQGGRLLVSMPEAPGKSGPNPYNPYHLHELTFNDFEKLLREFFHNVQIITHEDTLHNGKKARLMFGICQKGGK